MRKFIIAGAVASALLVPSVASADTPDGSFVFKKGAQSENASSIGAQSSAIKQNGQFVSGQDNDYGIDQTTTPGSRAALVQAALGH